MYKKYYPKHQCCEATVATSSITSHTRTCTRTRTHHPYPHLSPTTRIRDPLPATHLQDDLRRQLAPLHRLPHDFLECVCVCVCVYVCVCVCVYVCVCVSVCVCV
jgi:hypothetical protein